MIDPALIRTIGFRISEDRGRLLENIVFLHLKMQGAEIYFHKDQKECDFIIRKNNQITTAIQVTVSMEDDEVKNREIAGLIEALSAYHLTEGIILTEYNEGTFQIDHYKIKMIPIWKWLLDLSN
jgi:predicted AAA+ superfamily ATPase